MSLNTDETRNPRDASEHHISLRTRKQESFDPNRCLPHTQTKKCKKVTTAGVGNVKGAGDTVDVEPDEAGHANTDGKDANDDAKTNVEASDVKNTNPGKDADAGNEANDHENTAVKAHLCLQPAKRFSESPSESLSESPAPARVGVTGANVGATGAFVGLPKEKQEEKRGRHLNSPETRHEHTFGPFPTCVVNETFNLGECCQPYHPCIDGKFPDEDWVDVPAF